MKKNRSKICLSAILLFQLAAYLIRIDRDIFAFQEFTRQPGQAYSEQPLLKKLPYFNVAGLYPTTLLKSQCHNNFNRPLSIWSSIQVSFSSLVDDVLKNEKRHTHFTWDIAAFLHKQTISHKSSQDDESVPAYAA